MYQSVTNKEKTWEHTIETTQNKLEPGWRNAERALVPGREGFKSQTCIYKPSVPGSLNLCEPQFHHP